MTTGTDTSREFDAKLVERVRSVIPHSQTRILMTIVATRTRAASQSDKAQGGTTGEYLRFVPKWLLTD